MTDSREAVTSRPDIKISHTFTREDPFVSTTDGKRTEEWGTIISHYTREQAEKLYELLGRELGK